MSKLFTSWDTPDGLSIFSAASLLVSDYIEHPDFEDEHLWLDESGLDPAALEDYPEDFEDLELFDESDYGKDYSDFNDWDTIERELKRRPAEYSEYYRNREDYSPR